MNYKEIHDNDGRLDQLFQSARNEAPKYAFTEASSVITSALAIGVATAAHAKAFTSSIFKTKIFIMSASTITLITSAAIVYSSMTSAVSSKPRVGGKASYKIEEKKDKQETPGTENSENFVFRANDDTLKKVIIITENPYKIHKLEIKEDAIKALLSNDATEMKVIEFDFEGLKERIVKIEKYIEIESGKVRDWSGLTRELEDLVNLQRLSEDELIALSLDDRIAEEEDLIELLNDRDIQRMEHDSERQEADKSREKDERIIYRKAAPNNRELENVSFSVTSRTTVDELEDIKGVALKAGMKFDYTAKVKKNRITKLNLTMTLYDEQGKRKCECINVEMSGDEMFSHTIQWQENEDGKAVSFGKNECRIDVGDKTSYTELQELFGLVEMAELRESTQELVEMAEMEELVELAESMAELAESSAELVEMTESFAELAELAEIAELPELPELPEIAELAELAEIIENDEEMIPAGGTQIVRFIDKNTTLSDLEKIKEEAKRFGVVFTYKSNNASDKVKLRSIRMKLSGEKNRESEMETDGPGYLNEQRIVITWLLDENEKAYNFRFTLQE